MRCGHITATLNTFQITPGLGAQTTSLCSYRNVLSSRPIFNVSGHHFATPRTTRIVPIPPPTTETTGPNNAAVKPDSSAPNSFEVPMKMLFTAETRPRISSGVTSCTMVPRIITLTLSKEPIKKNMARENQNTCDNPNRTVAIPKPVTHQSKLRPAHFIGGK